MKNFTRRFLLALMLVPGLGAAAQAAEPFPEGCALVRQASLPFGIDHGHIVVEVAVNGHPLHFTVDTGGVFSAISGDAAQAIGLQPVPIGQQFRIKDAGGAEAQDYARIKYISFSKFRSENLTLMIVKLPPGEDGVLAPDLLRNFDVELDFASQTMNLFKQPRCDDHVVYWTDNFTKLPMEITEQGHIRIPVAVNGHILRGTVDTGSPLTLIGDDAAKTAIGDGGKTGRDVTISGNESGKISGTRIVAESLAVGKFKFLSPRLISAAGGAGWHANGSGMLLGLDILHDLHLFIDYKGEQFYVSQR